jgi:hypothetical protein
MKEIVLKTIIYIDGREIVADSRDFSESIAEYEKEQEIQLEDWEIVSYIIQS